MMVDGPFTKMYVYQNPLPKRPKGEICGRSTSRFVVQ